MTVISKNKKIIMMLFAAFILIFSMILTSNAENSVSQEEFVIDVQPTNVRLDSCTSEFGFSFHVTVSIDGCHYQWYRIPEGSTEPQMLENATQATYVGIAGNKISGRHLLDGSKYYCVITNPETNEVLVSDKATLRVAADIPEDAELHSDEKGHWYVCKCGKPCVSEPHTPVLENGKTVCSVCGYVIAENVPCEHSYGSEWKSDGENHWKECTKCGAKSEISAHTYDKGVVTKQPTCTETGVKTFTCTVCGKTYTESLPITSHTYGEWEKYNDTQHKRTCACGDTQYEDHSWDKGEVTKEATHFESGIITYKCTVCGQIREVIIPENEEHVFGEWIKVDENNHKRVCACGKEEIAPHTWNEGVITTQATEDNTGVRTYTCKICNATREEILPKLPHTHVFGTDWVSSKDGHWHECIKCGAKSEIVKHVPGEAPTEEHGQKCTICGYELAPKLEHVHKFSSEWIKNRDKHWHVCSCGEKADEAEHTWDSGVISVAPTTETEGAKMCTCTECGEIRLFKIPKLPSMIKFTPEWKSGSKEELLFQSDAPLKDFIGVTINGTELSDGEYTIKEGSTIIVINQDFAKTLKAGTYNISIKSSTGTANAYFTVVDSGLGLTEVLIIIAIVAMVVCVAVVMYFGVFKKKNRDNIYH